MSATTLRPEHQAPSSHLADSDIVTVLTVDLEPAWRPKSPLDVPRNPRAVGGMPVQRMPLAKLIEHNQEAIRTGGRFWWLAVELLAGDREQLSSAGNGCHLTERTGKDGKTYPVPEKKTPVASPSDADVDKESDGVEPAEDDAGDEADDASDEIECPNCHHMVLPDPHDGACPHCLEPDLAAIDQSEEDAPDEPGPIDGNGDTAADMSVDIASPAGACWVPSFHVCDESGELLSASITIYSTTPLVAVEYCGDLVGREIVPEHDAVAVARRFRLECPKAVTTIRPVHARRIVATVVVDFPEQSEEGGAV